MTETIEDLCAKLAAWKELALALGAFMQREEDRRAGKVPVESAAEAYQRLIDATSTLRALGIDPHADPSALTIAQQDAVDRISKAAMAAGLEYSAAAIHRLTTLSLVDARGGAAGALAVCAKKDSRIVASFWQQVKEALQ